MRDLGRQVNVEADVGAGHFVSGVSGVQWWVQVEGLRGVVMSVKSSLAAVLYRQAMFWLSSSVLRDSLVQVISHNTTFYSASSFYTCNFCILQINT